VVVGWSPQNYLLETVDTAVSITGHGFRDTRELECIFSQLTILYGPQRLSAQPAEFSSVEQIRCIVPSFLWKQDVQQVNLQITFDGGHTFPIDTAMTFTLSRAPQLTKLVARSAINTPATPSQLVGRPSVLRIYLKGTHLLSANPF
jgi:hypothetical protein